MHKQTLEKAIRLNGAIEALERHIIDIEEMYKQPHSFKITSNTTGSFLKDEFISTDIVCNYLSNAKATLHLLKCQFSSL